MDNLKNLSDDELIDIFKKASPVYKPPSIVAGLAGDAKGYYQSLHEPTEPATSAKDFATRVLPESIGKTTVGMVEYPYHLAKSFTDPLLTKKPLSGMQDALLSNIDAIARGTGEPIGLYGLKALKERWLSDPVGSALGVMPLLSGLKLKKVKPILEEHAKTGKRLSEIIDISPETIDKHIRRKSTEELINIVEQNKPIEAEQSIGEYSPTIKESQPKQTPRDPSKEARITGVPKSEIDVGKSELDIAKAKTIQDEMSHPNYNKYGDVKELYYGRVYDLRFANPDDITNINKYIAKNYKELGLNKDANTTNPKVMMRVLDKRVGDYAGVIGSDGKYYPSELMFGKEFIEEPKGVIERGQGQGYGQAETRQVAAQPETRILPEEQPAIPASQPEAPPAIAATPPVTTPVIKESLTEKTDAPSLREKIGEMHDLSFQIVDNKDLAQSLNKKDADLVYGIADGLTEKFIMDRINGRTSLQAMLDWPPGKLEKLVDDNIDELKTILKQKPAIKESLTTEPAVISGLKEPGSKPEPVAIEGLNITKNGNAVGFTKDGHTVTVGYKPNSKTWYVVTVEDTGKTQLPINEFSRNFPTKEDAGQYAAGIVDYNKTKEKAWWDTSDLKPIKKLEIITSLKEPVSKPYGEVKPVKTKPYPLRVPGLNNVVEGEYQGKPYHTDGNMILLSKPKIKPKDFKQVTEEQKTSMQNVLGDFLKSNEELHTINKITFQSFGKSAILSDNPIKKANKDSMVVVHLNTGDVSTTINQDYYNYVKKHYPDAEFRISKELESPVLVYNNNEVVGAVMPLNEESRIKSPSVDIKETPELYRNGAIVDSSN